MGKPLPKVSGLIKTGALTPASEDAVKDLPSFNKGTSEPTDEIGRDAAATSAPKQEENASGIPFQTVAPRQLRPAVSHEPVLEHGVTMLPLSKLKIHPFNSRTQRTQERIEEVRDMLEAEKIQREPITVVPGRKPQDLGFYYILSGQTRYHAANLAGWVELKSQINQDIDPDDHVAFFAASIEHNTSRPETDWDLAVKAKMLLDEKVDPAKIQSAIRRDARAYRRLIAMMELPEPILVHVRENPTKLTAVFCEVLKSAIPELGEDGIAALAKQTVEEDLSQRTLQQVIDRAIRIQNRDGGRAKRATREFMVPVVIGGDKKAGEFKVMQSSKVEGNRVITLSADLPENLAEILKADIEASIAKLKGDGRAS